MTTKIDYHKPLTMTGPRGAPLNLKAVPFGNGTFHEVTWDEDDRYVSGRCLFDAEGKWVGDLRDPTSPAGSGLTLENGPEPKEIFVRVSSMDDSSSPASLHRSAPAGAGVGVIKLTIEDGVIRATTLIRENKVPFDRVRFGCYPENVEGEKL